jgi:hypothetical protein
MPTQTSARQPELPGIPHAPAERGWTTRRVLLVVAAIIIGLLGLRAIVRSGQVASSAPGTQTTISPWSATEVEALARKHGWRPMPSTLREPALEQSARNFVAFQQNLCISELGASAASDVANMPIGMQGLCSDVLLDPQTGWELPLQQPPASR